MKYQAIIYFDNPVTRWQYSKLPVAPLVESDVIFRRTFHWKFFAEAYAKEKMKGMKNVKWRVEETLK